jgi:hypothetical protein
MDVFFINAAIVFGLIFGAWALAGAFPQHGVRCPNCGKKAGTFTDAQGVERIAKHFATHEKRYDSWLDPNRDRRTYSGPCSTGVAVTASMERF